MLVALGIDADGKKHVLGVREGATENAASCTALLTDLRDRGLRTDRAVLVVIDGGKALAKAVRNVFGTRAIVQRCQAHKARNVVEQLPDELRPSVRQAMRDAYAANDADRARTMLVNLGRRLRDEHPGAAASLDDRKTRTIGKNSRFKRDPAGDPHTPPGSRCSGSGAGDGSRGGRQIAGAWIRRSRSRRGPLATHRGCHLDDKGRSSRP